MNSNNSSLGRKENHNCEEVISTSYFERLRWQPLKLGEFAGDSCCGSNEVRPTIKLLDARETNMNENHCDQDTKTEQNMKQISHIASFVSAKSHFLFSQNKKCRRDTHVFGFLAFCRSLPRRVGKVKKSSLLL